MTIVELIKVIWQALVKNILYSRSDKAYRLIFITIFSIKVVISYFPILAPVGIINKFQLL